MIRYVHGSEDSLDLDVFYVFDETPSFNEAQKFCANKEENRNVICISDGIVSYCYKGTIDEINNGLMKTYYLHNQKYPLLITRKVERDILIKNIRVMRCLLSHCSRTQYRSTVKDALKSHSWKKRIEALASIDFKLITEYQKEERIEDVYKVFAFQLGQWLGLVNHVELYTKSEVASHFPDLRNYLYRIKGENVEILQQYINLFIAYSQSLGVSENEDYCEFHKYKKSIDLKREIYI